jgi:hypothetical protein
LPQYKFPISSFLYHVHIILLCPQRKLFFTYTLDRYRMLSMEINYELRLNSQLISLDSLDLLLFCFIRMKVVKWSRYTVKFILLSLCLYLVWIRTWRVNYSRTRNSQGDCELTFLWQQKQQIYKSFQLSANVLLQHNNLWKYNSNDGRYATLCKRVTKSVNWAVHIPFRWTRNKIALHHSTKCKFLA